jgi:hypothetical protein
LTETEIEIVEGIELVESFETGVPDPDYCFPYGGQDNYPRLVLQRRQRYCGTCGGVQGLVPCWLWDDWEDVDYFDFDESNEPKNEWDFFNENKLVTKEPVFNQLGQRVIFSERIVPTFTIRWYTLHCDQELMTFMYDRCYSWKRTAPITPAETGLCGLDTVESEQRRILYYPMGVNAVNRYGDEVGPIEIDILSFTHQRVNERYGLYMGELKVIATNGLPHHIVDDIVNADYEHSDDADTERNRAYQGIITFGDAE